LRPELELAFRSGQSKSWTLLPPTTIRRGSGAGVPTYNNAHLKGYHKVDVRFFVFNVRAASANSICKAKISQKCAMRSRKNTHDFTVFGVVSTPHLPNA